VLPIANTDRRTTERSTSDSLDDVSWIQKAAFTAVQKECATPPHVQVRHHVTQFYQAFPHVSTASDKRWGEKAWVRGYIMCELFISSVSAIPGMNPLNTSYQVAGGYH